jgi:hypothetical protein
VRLPFAARNSDPESTSAYFSKGEKPADLLPIQSTEFDLVIHLTTPEADGVAILPCCLLPVDEAIRTPMFPAGQIPAVLHGREWRLIPDSFRAQRMRVTEGMGPAFSHSLGQGCPRDLGDNAAGVAQITDDLRRRPTRQGLAIRVDVKE